MTGGPQVDDLDLDHVHDLLRSVCSARAPEPERSVDVQRLKRGLERDYRVVNVQTRPSAAEGLDFLSPRFLAEAAKGQAALGQASLHGDAARIGVGSVRSRAIVDTLGRGSRSVLNPFTGEVDDLRSSLGQDWLLLVHDGDLCFASQMGGAMVAVYLETVWVFPGRKLIVRVDNGLDDAGVLNETAKLYRNVLRRSRAVADYLDPGRERSRRVALADFWCPHMSHNLWNVQTGWANVLAHVAPSPDVGFLLFGGQNFFGSLDELFPSGASSRSAASVVSNQEELFDASLAGNFLVCTVKDETFTPAFAESVLARAYAHCSKAFLDEVDRLRKRCRPLVMTTIRLDNRAWLEQRDGNIALFRALKEAHPDIGLVIDGLSSDTVKGWTTGWMSLDAEMEVATAIRDGLDGTMPVILGVGRTFVESIVLMDACDLFVAPSGSGMAIYKWICNKPGLAYSNRAVLDEASPHKWPLRVWHDRTFRADMCPTKHLDARLVDDADMARGHASRSNFHLDWRILHRETLAYMEELAAAGGF